MSINKSVADPYESIDINTIGNHNVFAAAADHGVKRLVFASSRLGLRRPREAADARGRHAATRSRRTASASAPARTCSATTSGRSGLSWIALRFFNVYGPGQKTTAYYTSVINHFVNRLKNGEPPVIDGKGEQSMDFIHVHDIARAVVAGADLRAATTCRSTSAPASTRSIAELARSSSTPSASTSSRSSTRATCSSRRRAADITRAREVLGFEPEIDVERGMTDLVRGNGR